MTEKYPEFSDKMHIYYATRNKEFFIRADNQKGAAYDFVITELKYAIEFNGEHVHPSPEIVNSKELQETWKSPYNISYEDARNKDLYKKKLIEDKGFELDYIWYKEYKSNPDACVNRVVSKLIQLYEKYKKSLV